jgi:hypothetical protein
MLRAYRVLPLSGERGPENRTGKVKITEIKVTAGKDVIVFEPTSATWVIAAKSGNLPEKLATKLWKTLTGSVEQYFDILKGAKSTDFKA